MSIIIVDDNQPVRTTMATILREAGFTVREASNTADALSLVGDGKGLLAMVIDMVMPGAADGCWLAWRMRFSLPNVALIVMSGEAHPAVGVLPPNVAFLAKPIRVQKLVSEVRAAIARCDPRSGAA